ncbi:MAG: nuclear transport factor 2 family protein [Solirubrobacteraceae bacterium MAG38_C4-C5]|nr:nuclear transport factor 2 family protein [Candidatus Siliceabacter maunaloa]
MQRVTIATFLTAGVLALVAAGCGKSDFEQVETTMQDFATGIAEEDYTGLCDDILAGELVVSVRSVGLDCPVALSLALEEVQAPRLEIVDIDIEDDEALARVRTTAEGQEPSEDAVRLVKQDGDWRVASLSAAQPQPPPAPVAP